MLKLEKQPERSCDSLRKLDQLHESVLLSPLLLGVETISSSTQKYKTSTLFFLKMLHALVSKNKSPSRFKSKRLKVVLFVMDHFSRYKSGSLGYLPRSLRITLPDATYNFAYNIRHVISLWKSDVVLCPRGLTISFEALSYRHWCRPQVIKCLPMGCLPLTENV